MGWVVTAKQITYLLLDCVSAPSKRIDCGFEQSLVLRAKIAFSITTSALARFQAYSALNIRSKQFINLDTL